MINAILDQFLDNGWANEAEIYYKEHIYFLECDLMEDGRFHFFFRKWKVRIVHEVYFVSLLGEDDHVIDYDDSFEIYGDTYEGVREEFLKAPIWEGKAFWEVEKELAWYDWNGLYQYENGTEMFDYDDHLRYKKSAIKSKQKNDRD